MATVSQPTGLTCLALQHHSWIDVVRKPQVRRFTDTQVYDRRVRITEQAFRRWALHSAFGTRPISRSMMRHRKRQRTSGDELFCPPPFSEKCRVMVYKDLAGYLRWCSPTFRVDDLCKMIASVVRFLALAATGALFAAPASSAAVVERNVASRSLTNAERLARVFRSIHLRGGNMV